MQNQPSDRSQDHPPTSDRLRRDIDRGQGGDKVVHADQAAAPLGTDDEAAGTPPAAEEVALAQAQETRTTAEARQRSIDWSAGRVPWGRPWLIGGAGLLVGLLLILWLLA